MKTLLIAMIRLYPRPFRREFGASIADDIRADYERAQRQGSLATIAFVAATAFDLTRSAIAERINPTWNAHVATVEAKDMKWFLDDWARDFRHAARALRRSPGFTAVTVGTLGLAIGVNAGMYSIVSRVLLNPLPFPEANRLVHIGATAPGSDFPAEFTVSAEFYVHYKEHSKLIENISIYNSFTSTLKVDDRVERVRMSWPTNSLYSVLGVKPMLGRLPVTEDGASTVVISHALWSSWFGGDSSVIGRMIVANGDPRQIIGVMGPDFRFPDDGTLLWISDEYVAAEIQPGRFNQPLVARLKPGVTPEALALELTMLSKQLPERFGGSANYRKVIEQHRALVRPANEQVLGAVGQPIKVLLGAVSIVLLIACANVANLFMVRAEGRQREVAVRRAIGANRRELVRLQLSESMVVAALASVFAVLFAMITLPAFLRAAPPDIPRILDVKVDGSTIAFTVLAALVAALLCGIVPAWRASSPDLARLKEGGRGSTRGRRALRAGLVAAQTALALVLLIGSGLLMKSFWALRHVDPGYETRDLMTFQIAPDRPRTAEEFALFHMTFADRIRALPGVQSVGLIENVPLNEGTALASFRTEEMAPDPVATRRLRFTFASGDYFGTVGIRLQSGQAFAVGNLEKTHNTVMLSRSAADALWPGQDAVGRRLQMTGHTEWSTVIGVVADVKQNNFREDGQAVVYYPLVVQGRPDWRIGSPAYVVKTSRAESIAPEIRALVKEVAPEAPMYRVFTMDRLVKDSMVQLSFTMLTLGILSVLALILGAVGLYGVLSYVVAERTREIGVRMALGARADQVRRMVVAQGARVVSTGVLVGVIASLASTRILSSLLFGVAPLDWMTFLAMSASMTVIGLVASYLPARRASRVDPIQSLRSE